MAWKFDEDDWFWLIVIVFILLAVFTFGKGTTDGFDFLPGPGRWDAR